MTDIFSMFPNQMFDTNNNQAANSAGQFQSATSRAMSDKAMLQMNAYPASVDYNQNMYAFPDESANCFYNNGQYRMQTEEHSPHKPETIHSGHFMVSEIDDAENEPNAEEEAAKEEDKEELIKADQQQVVEIKSIEQSSHQLLSHNLRSGRKNWDSKWNIDYPKSNQSLDSLFKKMNLGLDSKLVSPKWKQFKGMKISLKNKIRVNNLIWRAWHIKYVLGRTPPFNPFPSQLDKAQLDMSHIYVVHRPEVMKIGKFFGGKRESCDDFIALEYIKWRRYYKEIIQKQNNQYKNSANQWNNVDAFGYPYDNSNDQFNTEIFHPMNNYSSAQLGIGAEFMQPELTYGIQAEFMDTWEEPCLQNFLAQKSSFLPTLVEEDSIQDSPKLQEMPPQSIYPSADSSMTTDLNYDQQQQMQPVVGRQIGNQMSSQLNNNQLQQQAAAVSQQIQPTSPANYSYLPGYHSQPQSIMQSQPNQQISSMSYRQNAYMPNNCNLMLDQQNASLSLTANLNGQQQSALSALSPQGTPHQSMMASIENPLNSLNANLNGNVQVSGGQFAVPNKPAKQKTRSRSVSSLPKQHQAQLQRHHMIENSSSMMEINQPLMTNQSSFHNTTSNLLSSQQQQQQQQQANALQNQTNLSALEQQQIRKNSGYMRCNELNQQQTAIMNSQVMQQQPQHLPNLNNQLQPATNASANYYTMNLNEVNSMSAVSNITNSIGSTQSAQSGSPLSIEYSDRSMRNSSSSSASYYSGVQQMSTNSNANQPALQPSASNYSLSKYQSSNDTGTNLISQLLSTNNPKLAASNLSGSGLQPASSNLPFKRNSTGTYPNFSPQYGQLHDQFGGASIPNSSSVSSLAMSSASVNTNSNSNQSSLTSSVNTNDPTSYHRGNQLLRKSKPHHQPNRPFAFNSSNNAGLNSMRNAASIGNQLVCAQQTTDSKHGALNLASSLENLNKSCSISTKSHRIKREHQHRKLSNSKLRNSPSGLSRSNSSKSVSHSPVSPTTSLQATLMSQQQQANNAFSFFDRNLPSNGSLTAGGTNLNSINSNLQSSLCSVLNSNLSPNLSSGLVSNIGSNLNSANSSSLSSTPTQSPLTNSSFTSRNEYPADSLPLYNPNAAFAFLDQSLCLNGQLTKSTAAFKSSHSSNNSSTNSNNLASPSGLIKNERDPNQYKEHRRVCHINAEQKRRCNIKHGFDTLRAILPSISANNNTKISKASMLQKGAEHIRQLRIEQETQNAEIQQLRSQIESLNQTIGIFQNQLPASGAPVSGMRPGQIKERFDDYVREKTQSHWKFWMFSIIMEPLLDSYNNTIPATNFDELSSSVLRWLDQNCNLVHLRKEVLNSLRVISTSTNVLTNPSLLAEESLLKVQKKAHKKK